MKSPERSNIKETHFVVDSSTVFGGMVGAMIGIIAGAGLVYYAEESGKPAPIFDCSQGRGGSIDLNVARGQEYPMKSLSGSSARLEVEQNGAVTVFIKDSDNNSIKLQAPVTIESDFASFTIDKATSKTATAKVTAVCKIASSATPSATSTR